MKKKAKKEKQLKTESVEILVTSEIKKALREAAKRNYTSDGNYCRQLLVEDLRRKGILLGERGI